MATKLTARQAQVLNLVRRAILATGRPPTRAELAQALGFRSANAAEDHLKALARKGYLKLTAGSSRGIQLTPLDDAARSAPSPAEAAAPAYREANWTTLPLIGRVAAGAPILATEHIEAEIPITAHLFTARADYLLRVHGTSMQNAGILDGDLLAVQRTPEARHGQIVVARLGEEVTVKRLEHRGATVRLLPENPAFQPIVVGPADDFAIEGIAVGLIRTAPLH